MGRLSSAALRWPRAQENIGFQGFNLEWGSRALHKAASYTVPLKLFCFCGIVTHGRLTRRHSVVGR